MGTKRDFALAAKAIIMKDGKALLLRRSRQEMEKSRVNRQEAWDLPGGGIRFFETVEKGLMREIREETSLSVSLLKPLCVYDAIRNEIHLSIFTYLCDYQGGGVTLSPEHESYHWMDLSELLESGIPKWLLRDLQMGFYEYRIWKKMNIRNKNKGCCFFL